VPFVGVGSNEPNHKRFDHHILEVNDWHQYAPYNIRSRADHDTFQLRDESLPHPFLGYCVCIAWAAFNGAFAFVFHLCSGCRSLRLQGLIFFYWPVAMHSYDEMILHRHREQWVGIKLAICTYEKWSAEL
jgi:hypothetical protein